MHRTSMYGVHYPKTRHAATLLQTMITAGRYQELIRELITLLESDKCYAWFQQDNVRPHFSRESMAILWEFFDSWLISAE